MEETFEYWFIIAINCSVANFPVKSFLVEQDKRGLCFEELVCQSFSFSVTWAPSLLVKQSMIKYQHNFHNRLYNAPHNLKGWCWLSTHHGTVCFTTLNSPIPLESLKLQLERSLMDKKQIFIDS